LLRVIPEGNPMTPFPPVKVPEETPLP
jgi:hypothetical protein